MRIDKSILRIEKLIPFFEKKNLKVSAVNVGWHLDHSLKVINSASDALKHSDPKNYKSTFGFIKSYVFLTKSIPRGKAKAPKRVVSTVEISKEAIEEQLNLAKMNLLEVKKLHANNHFPHPLFGMLPLNKSLLFLAIHTNHHLKIVNDIIETDKE